MTWITGNGKSFGLVWSDYQNYAAMDWEAGKEEFERPRAHASSEEELLETLAEFAPYYAFNAQHVDLTIS